MRQRFLIIVCVAIGGSFVIGCTGTNASDAGAGGPRGNAPASAPAGNACDRHLVTQEDVAGILRDPIAAVKSLAADGDPQTCSFETASLATVNITVRPGLGDTTVDAWLGGRMPVQAEPLTDIGDHAAWCPDLSEVIATKHNLLCDVSVGGAPGTAAAKNVIKQRLGELCNKVFAKS
jgi:hypothetical protein